MILIVCLSLMVSVVNGMMVTRAGRFTPFTSAGHGACGQLIDPSHGLFASLGQAHFTTINPNEDPVCHQCIQVSYNGRTLILPVVDKCGGCDTGDLLLSAPAFQYLAQSNSAWEINSGSWGFSSCTPPPTPPPTSTEIIFVGNGELSYYASAGYAACGGRVNGSADWNVAMSHEYFSTINPNSDPICQKCVQLDYRGVSMLMPIKDKCGGCPKNRIMASQAVMESLQTNLGQLGYLPALVEGISWKVVSCQ